MRACGQLAIHVIKRHRPVLRIEFDGRGFRRSNQQVNRPFIVIRRTFRRDPAVFNGHGDLRKNSLRRILRARGGFARRHGIVVLVPAGDLHTPVGMRVNPQHGSFGLRQAALLGAHDGVPVVKTDMQIGAIGDRLLVAVRDAHGVVMPRRSCSGKPEGEQGRRGNQQSNAA